MESLCSISNNLTMTEEIEAFESLLTRTKFLNQDLQEKIMNEKIILAMLNKKVKVAYDYIKPESEDLRGKSKVLMKLRKSKKKTDANKVLEEMQELLDKFNQVRQDLKYAKKALQHFISVFKVHAKEFDDCENLYAMNTSESGDEHAVNLSIVRITTSSLPTFEWEIQNWRCKGQDLVDRYNDLLVTHRFDLLMAKFDKILRKLI